MLNENMCWHVPRMGNGRCDFGVTIRGIKRKRCVEGVIKRMNGVMRCTWVVTIVREDSHGNGAGLDF